MMWKEFEEIAGYEVEYETYTNVIEPMYMATNMSKYEFVNCLNKKAFALPTEREMLKEMKEIATYIFENCGRQMFYELEEKLTNLSKTFAKRFYGVDCNADCCGVWFEKSYAYCGGLTDRGCTFPEALEIISNGRTIKRIQLVKC